ncbi:hypothetical protein [Sorangium sp. So ce1000]|uniref:hypothetical protein n=1 Tax=Sorangium sp. So ce1000 TaxID=3133325 RepID=UPI003F609E3C
MMSGRGVEPGSEPGSFDEHHAEQAPHEGRNPSPELLASWAVARNRERRARAVRQGQESADGGEP